MIQNYPDFLQQTTHSSIVVGEVDNDCNLVSDGPNILDIQAILFELNPIVAIHIWPYSQLISAIKIIL